MCYTQKPQQRCHMRGQNGRCPFSAGSTKNDGCGCQDNTTRKAKRRVKTTVNAQSRPNARYDKHKPRSEDRAAAKAV
eukprot:scaffold316973_cov32-Tisochrysis_lutea.AAC.1